MTNYHWPLGQWLLCQNRKVISVTEVTGSFVERSCKDICQHLLLLISKRTAFILGIIKPSQVVVEIFCGYSSEFAHKIFQLAVIAVNMANAVNTTGGGFTASQLM